MLLIFQMKHSARLKGCVIINTWRTGQLRIEREIDSRLIKFLDERDFMLMKTYVCIFFHSFFFFLIYKSVVNPLITIPNILILYCM